MTLKGGRLSFLFFLLFVFLNSGCAGLVLKNAPVAFQDPYSRFEIVPVEPNAEEEAGILLRAIPPPENVSEAREESVIFARIKKGKGMRLDLVMDRVERYKPGSAEGFYLVFADTTLEGQEGRFYEETEQNQRGEITRFIRGFHHSKQAKITLTSWFRNPIFPMGKVKRGEHWSYDEELGVKIESRWLKEIDPEPYKIQAACHLEGFALVKGIRCAVIKTVTRQTKREHFKVLFRDVLFNIQAQIEETTFFDYQKGRVLARVTSTTSDTYGANIPVTDKGQSQSVFYLKELTK